MALFNELGPGGKPPTSLRAPLPGEAYDPAAREYDISAFTGGLGMMKESPYKTSTYSPYQFSTPGLSAMQPYGKTSTAALSDIYGKSLSTAVRPLRAQSEATMRGFGQGMQGAQFGGAAQRELAMKQSQKLGSDISDVGGRIGSEMAMRGLTEEETAREADYRDVQNVRNQMFQAERERQQQQSAENFISAGFNEESARYMANLTMQRAQKFMEGGTQLAGMQRQLTTDAYNQLMGEREAGRQMVGSWQA